jgi:hypothetical protein
MMFEVKSKLSIIYLILKACKFLQAFIFEFYEGY